MKTSLPELPPPPSRLGRLLCAALLIALGWSLGLMCIVAVEYAGVRRAALRTAPVVAVQMGNAAPGAHIPTPARPGDPCPDPLSHTGPFDPRTGEPRAGGYKTVQQIDAGNR